MRKSQGGECIMGSNHYDDRLCIAFVSRYYARTPIHIQIVRAFSSSGIFQNPNTKPILEQASVFFCPKCLVFTGTIIDVYMKGENTQRDHVKDELQVPLNRPGIESVTEAPSRPSLATQGLPHKPFTFPTPDRRAACALSNP